MIRRTLFLATTIAAGAVVVACSDTTAPKQFESAEPAPSLIRSGALNLTKDCSAYTGQAGDTCTVTTSNLAQIEPGSTIIYASAAVGAALDTDVRLDPPGPGNNVAYGHCTLSLATGVGLCTFSGGTGKFTWFHANAAVSYVSGPTFAWDGTYSFSPRD